MEECKLHPDYKGKKKPTNMQEGCTCAEIYLILHNKPRFPINPTKVEKDDSKYSRKEKHKKRAEGYLS